MKPFSRDLISKASKGLSSINVEPAAFLLTFSVVIDDIALSQMVIDKSCRQSGYNDTVCANLLNYTEINLEIQAELSQFAANKSVIDSVFPIFFAFYMGAWADLFGRKPLFFIYFAAQSLTEVIIIICAVFAESKKEFLLLSGLPVSVAGGYATWAIAMNAYIADTCAPDDRASKIGLVSVSMSLGATLGGLFGAYLLSAGGFVCVYAVTLTGIVSAGLALMLAIRRQKWQPGKPDRQRHMFSPLVIKDSVESVLKKRAGPSRKYLLVLFAISIFDVLPFQGEYTILYNYVRTMFGWEVTEFTQFQSLVLFAGLVAQIIFIPAVKVLNFNEAWVMALAYSSALLRHIIRCVASQPWMFYLSGFVDMLSVYGSFVMNAMIASCVSPNELGKSYALLSALNTLLAMGLRQLYAFVWKRTDATFPGAVYTISIGLSSMAVACAFYIAISLKGKQIASKLGEATVPANNWRITEIEGTTHI